MNNSEFLEVNEDQLQAELRRQASIYAQLGVSESVIMNLAPPKNIPIQYTHCVVTLGSSVDLSTLIKLTDIWMDPHILQSRDAGNGKTYNEPHLIYMYAGDKLLGRSARWVRDNVSGLERPAVISDLVAFAITQPDAFDNVLGHYNIDAAGSIVGDNWVAYVGQHERNRGIHARPDDAEKSNFTSALSFG